MQMPCAQEAAALCRDVEGIYGCHYMHPICGGRPAPQSGGVSPAHTLVYGAVDKHTLKWGTPAGLFC